ncbi:SsgA family sporulation/cell division regulator [Nonomuraea typhae]|uniref:SsgA family sporulation/cell division regulator n=1 Tax=Nonomuraea typhae TaxID=2603600 RepID=A0ABW7YS18_9ACTN
MREVTISQGLTMWTARHGDGGLHAWLHFDVDEPFEVELELLLDGSTFVSWVFDRSLLARGAEEPAGEGRVRIAPHVVPGFLLLELYLAGEGAEPIRCSASALVIADFVARTHVAAPLELAEGLAAVELEDFLVGLLGEGAA